jgi:hypothetical protein
MAQGADETFEPSGLQRQDHKDLPHASSAALDRIEDLLGALRAVKGLRETSRGRFYRRGRTFLHFHEQGDDLFADVRWTGLERAFERTPVTTPSEREALLDRVKESLAKPR